MTGNRVGTPLGLISAAVLILVAAFVGWIAVRTTAVDIAGASNSPATLIMARQPEFVLGAAMNAFAADRGRLPPSSLPAVRRAAAAMPLDDRPYLLIGSGYVRAGQTDRGLQTLEAGRRLDPRQRWIHLLLLERYLGNQNFSAAAQELAVLARLIGAAQAPIAAALAQMSVAPETRDAVRQTLRQDVSLESAVLTALAGSDVEPATIFAMASPGALAAANVPGGWGTALVDRLVKDHRYRAAHTVWQRISRLSDQQVEPLLYDAGLDDLPGNPPFAWKLESGNVAAVDVRNHALQIDYYGRDGGDLVSQLLVLPPGAYRFAHAIRGSQQTAGSTLAWSIECDNQPDRSLARLPLPLDASTPRQVGVQFTVPAGCPAQRLHLIASPGEFPAPVSATIERLQLRRLSGK